MIFSLILRGNTHISETFLRMLLLGATLSTKIFHEYGPRAEMKCCSDFVLPGMRASFLQSYSIPSWKGLPRAAVSITPTVAILNTHDTPLTHFTH